MSFSADWLALREPADRAARDGDMLSRAASHVGQGAIVLDLGSGTGSTARAFEHAGQGWTWHFLDGDKNLLEVAKRQHPGAQTTVMNLRDLDNLPLDDVALVTASALLDLMPVDWMHQLARRLRDAAVPFYAALNYNGIMQWSHECPGDAAVTQAFNQHQQTDKGIGPAMGAASAKLATQILTEHGFDVTLADSPWRLDQSTTELHHQLLDGIADAAGEMGYDAARDWLDERRANLPISTTLIGHTDILAVPRTAD